MVFLGWALLIALCVISCGYFKAKKSDVWWMNGIVVGCVLFIAFWWVLPILWGLMKIAFWLAIVGLIGFICFAAVKVLAKNAS